MGVNDPDIKFADVFPAKIDLYVDWQLLTQERQELIEPIAWAIKRILASGVGMRLYVRTYRTCRFDLPISRGGAVMADFDAAPPIGQDKTFLRPVAMAHSTYLLSAAVGILPDTPRTARVCQNSTGGVFTRTHIKPRRID